MNDKITPAHLDRAAYVYIRQSTLQQVRHNRESNRRQYGLEQRARELGFTNIVIIDDDLGVSGSGSRDRRGFARLLTAVCEGAVGGVFALEASRLARNNRDWHHLIDLCVFTDTLVVDADGVYDPRLLNDRLLLGMKGSMSEFELGLLRQRAQESCRQKVMRGEVLTKVPIGYVRSGATGIEMTPDREIQAAVRGVFTQFERLGTLRQVLLWYLQEKMRMPVLRCGTGADTTEWVLPNYQQLLRILKNPTYAGAFAWGRTCSRSQIVDGRSRKSVGHRIGMDRWQVLLKDHHLGYISWERFVENQKILASNLTKSGTGAAKRGPALLAGLLRCAQCGHKLHIGYRGRDGRSPRYYCMAGQREKSGSSCLAFGGVKVDRAVVDAVLEACKPIGIEASLQLLEGGRVEQDQKRRTLELALQRARYAADLARRQYDSVDPANRLVAAELEARWNAALVQASEAEARLHEEQRSRAPLTDEQRRRLLDLGSDLQTLWNDRAAPLDLKKRILRTVINEIIVSVNRDTEYIDLHIHWVGGVHTSLRVRKNHAGRNGHATDHDVVTLVRELAKARPDGFIAATLNRLGHRTGPGNTWNETRVRHLRNYHEIPVFVSGTEPVWVSAEEAAKKLNVGVTVVRTMIRHGLLPARQLAKDTPWMINPRDLQQIDVQNYAKQARTGKAAPREDTHQTVIPFI